VKGEDIVALHVYIAQRTNYVIHVHLNSCDVRSTRVRRFNHSLVASISVYWILVLVLLVVTFLYSMLQKKFKVYSHMVMGYEDMAAWSR
jgi:hypothetical protein